MAWRALPILLLLGMVGCACKPAAEAPTTQPVVIYVDRPAAALAYAPPVALAAGVPASPLDLSRARRDPAAFVGYDTGLTEFYWLRTDDRVRFYLGGSGSRSGTGGGWSNDRYERRSVTTRVGAIFR